MADAAVALAVNAFPNGVDNTQRRQIVYGVATITANAGTAPATGLPLDWSAMSNTGGTGNFQPQVGPSVSQPDFVNFTPATDSAAAEQLYTFDPTNNSLIVWRAGAPATSGILADTVKFKAEFIRNV